jgi:putative ABC transport system permease protein
MQVIAGNKNWATLVAGIDGDYLVAREWRLQRGRSFAANELNRGGKVAIVGSAIIQGLFPGSSGLRETVRIGNVPFTIVGILEPKGQGAAGRSQDDVIFIPLSTAKSRVLGAVRGTRDAMDFLLIKASDQKAMPKVEAEIRSLLRDRHDLRQESADDFSIDNPADVLTANDAAARTFSYLLISVASVSLIVGGISIMNVMLVSVAERVREIGLRVAVGAQRKDIQMQFILEAASLALVGGFFGVVGGCIGAIIIAWQAGWPVLISVEAIWLSWAFAGLIGMIFGFYPAYRAARLDPIAALRCE